MADFYYSGPGGKFRKLTATGETFDGSPVYAEPVIALPNIIESAPAVLTRPANVTAYAANDAITDVGGGAITIAVSLANDAPVGLAALNLYTNDTGFGQSITVEAYIYNAATTPVADNAAFAYNLAGLVGIMSGTFKAAADGGVAVLTPITGQYLFGKPIAGTKNFNVILKSLVAFTPSANSTTISHVMKAVQGA